MDDSNATPPNTFQQRPRRVCWRGAMGHRLRSIAVGLSCGHLHDTSLILGSLTATRGGVK